MSKDLSVNNTTSSGLLNTSNQHIKFNIQVKLNSQSPSGNSSNVDVKLIFTRINEYTGGTGPAPGNCTVTINGTDYKYEWEDYRTIKKDSYTTLFEKKDITIKHESNGKKTFSISLKSFYMQVSNPGLTQASTLQSESFVLPTIPRESTIEWKDKSLTFNGSPVYLKGTITPKFKEAQHSIILHINGNSHSLMTKTVYNNTTSNNFRILLGPKVLEDIYKTTITSASTTGTAEFITYASGTKVGSATKDTLTFKIGDAYKPNAFITHVSTKTNYYTSFTANTNGGITASSIKTSTNITSDDTSWSSTAESQYIPGLLSGISEVSGGISGLVGIDNCSYLKEMQCIINSSQVNSTKYNLNEKTTQATYTSSKYYKVSSPSGVSGKCLMVGAYVYDFRGKSSSALEYRTVYKYSKPTITKYIVKTNGDTKISCSLNISAVSNIKIWAFIRYKKSDESKWSNWSQIGTATQQKTGLHSFSTELKVDSDSSSYQVQFAVYDATGTQVSSAYITPQTGDVLIGISSNNKSMIIGGPVSNIHNTIGKLDVSIPYTVIRSADTILESSNLKFSGIGSGSGSPLVIDSTSSRTVMISSSSKKYKTNIEYNLDTEKLHDQFMQLKPVKFNYKSTPDVTDYGLIAEDVYDIDPDFTNYNPTTNDVENFKDRSILVLLINEIQRSNKRVTELEEIIEKLIQK